jgi:hypothetical protein
MRVYIPATLPRLADLIADGSMQPLSGTAPFPVKIPGVNS